MLTPRQEVILRKVVEAYAETGVPVGSKALATDPDIEAGIATVHAVAEQDGRAIIRNAEAELRID